MKASENGSRILSNGLVILVEEDLIDYYKGSLIFHNYNTNIQTQ